MSEVYWSSERRRLFEAVTARARSLDERLLALAEARRAGADPDDVVEVRQELVREHERETAR